MTQKKNIASKLVLVLFVLTLLSCCLLGSTFARYVSGGNGSASVGIAKWDVNVNTSVESTIEFDKLSPSMDAAASASGANRTHSTGLVKVAEITNSGEVDAEVTISVGEIDFAGVTFGHGYEWQTDKVAGDGPSEAQVEALFSIKLYYTTDDTAATGNEITSGTAIKAKLAKGGGIFYIWAEVTWTSTDLQNGGTTFGDAVDTWVGKNVKTISYSFAYTAVQDSELPTT